MQEYLIYYERRNKVGDKYYYQIIEQGIEGEEGYKIIWRGKVKKTEWEWALMICKEQPNRCIINQNGMICLKN